MKKVICTFFIILFLPYNIFAYSNNVIPGGDSIGININSKGLIIVGLYKVGKENINKNLKIGDRIIKVNNKEISSINDLTRIIDEDMKNNEIDITIIRKNKQIETKLYLKEENNKFKTGLYVKDTISGLGTLTYIDPISKIYGSLGHEIKLVETNERVEVKDGSIFESKITSISKSRNGSVGSKNANVLYSNKLGNIKTNINSGLYGIYTKEIPKRSTIKVGEFEDIKLGEAYILTVTKDDKINKYKIKILDKYNNKKDTDKAFSFEIVDEELLNSSGGIVQGMSGSPIIQNNKLIGAVTNVVIDNVNLGYGISIITMLKEGDKIGN